MGYVCTNPQCKKVNQERSAEEFHRRIQDRGNNIRFALVDYLIAFALGVNIYQAG